MRTGPGTALPLALLLGAGAATPRAAGGADADPRTPNEFLSRGTPTFVRGTAGDDASDRRVAVQVDLLRGMLFPDARVVDDDAVDAAKGPDAWPENPVVYGGPHVNSLVRRVGLPFALRAGRLAIGEEEFTGDEHRVIAVVPRRAPKGDDPGHPPFLLYAGTGTPGVTEINGTPHGRDPLLVVDRFGPRVRGSFDPTTREPTSLYAFPRPEWSTSFALFAYKVSGALKEISVARERKRGLSPNPLHSDDAESEACQRGLWRAYERLGSSVEVVAITVYVYDSAKRKGEVTGRVGDGHADMLSRTLHVRRVDPKALEDLVAHEATHVLADAAWGPAGTPLLGEGLAVWAAGAYGGRPLADARWRLRNLPPLADLLGAKFRSTPEPVSYPAGGLLVDSLDATVGLDRLREHLYPASAAGWADACVRAGTTAKDVEAAWRRALEGK